MASKPPTKLRLGLFKRPVSRTALMATFNAATETEANAAATAWQLSNVPHHWKRELGGPARAMHAPRYRERPPHAARSVQMRIIPPSDATEEQIASVRNAIAKLASPLY